MSDLIPGLPEEIALECLTRIHCTTHGVAAAVCRRWRQLLHCKHFYYHRKQTGHTHKLVCLVQSHSTQPDFDQHSKPDGPVCRHGLSMFDPANRNWEWVEPVPGYPEGLPLFCQVISSEGKLVVVGGWDPVSYEPLSHVFVFEFTTWRWRQVKNLPGSRSFFALGEFNGNIIIAGGHDQNKDSLDSAWDQDEWELARISQGRDECEGLVLGSQFWVVSGYKTENQGGLKGAPSSLNSRSPLRELIGSESKIHGSLLGARGLVLGWEGKVGGWCCLTGQMMMTRWLE